MTTTRTSRLSLGLTICGVAAMTACGGQVEEDIGISNEFLTRAMSCDHLAELLREDARAQLETVLAYELGYGETPGAPPARGGWDDTEASTDGAVSGGDPSGGAGGSNSGGTGGPVPPSDGGGEFGDSDSNSANEGAAGPSGHSTTNNQVRGVDEADILKTAHDGSRLWLLHKNRLTTLATWPPQSLGLENSLDVEGNAREMFVSHDRAVIFSDIYREDFANASNGGGGRGGLVGGGGAEDVSSPPEMGSGSTNGSGGAPGEPSPVPEPGPGGTSSGGSTSGEGGETGTAGTAGAGGATGEGGTEPPPDEDFEGEDGSGGDKPDGMEYWGPNGVQITIVSLAGEQPQVEKTFQVSGHYVSARRHDSTVRVVINESLRGLEVPDLPNRYWEGESAAMDAWIEEVNTLIDNSEVADWIMPRFEGIADATTQLDARCGDFYAPKPGSTSGGLTSVVTFDLQNASLGGANILGNGNTVYANQDKLVIGHPEWFNGFWDEETNSTILHAFSVSASPTTGYLASGRVAGMLNNQFSLDASGNTIRAATTVEEFTNWGRYTQVSVLGIDGDSLEELGNTGPMAPDESIFAVRYIGDMAYVVTFLQKDPLFAIDLSDPTSPTILGQLEIPGFSTYMHPLDSTHLLTIGRDRQGDGWSGDALALQVFDVGNPLTPKLSHKHVLDQEGSSSAEYEHKSFTFYSRDEGDLLAIPFEGWSYEETWDEDGTFESGGYHSSLELFSVDITNGINPEGGVDHSEYAGSDGCNEGYCYGGNFMRRGVFIDKYLYSISVGAVTVHDVSDLANPVAVLPLP